MNDQYDTYDRRIQLGASRRRSEDAEALHKACRWAGAIYLAGYAVECSLKALICYYEHKDNFKETHLFKQGNQGATLHDLYLLRKAAPVLDRTITNDRTGKYKDAWNTVTSIWRKDELRYWDKLGDRSKSKKFLEAVKLLHSLILRYQGEAS